MLPQRSALAITLFNLHISELPNTPVQKFGYADDLAVAVQDKYFKATEIILIDDPSNLNVYFKKLKIIPNINKTEVNCFNLNNR